MNFEKLNELVVGLVLVVAIAAIVVVTIISGSDSLAATGLKDLAILLGGGLLGSKIPKP